MNQTHLVLDVSNLAYRALYTVGQLSHEGEEMGVLFGIFREVKLLRDKFQPDALAFCFDGRRLLRKQKYPSYKEGRALPSPEWEAGRLGLYKQLKLLRKELLTAVGFCNVFHRDGFEADDLIASVCGGMLKGDQAIIISTDNDLWQLLQNDRVMLRNPITKKLFTAEMFRKKWGIDPVLWADVKALAGCKSDNVEGIKGVGPHRAVKFLCGKMKSKGAVFDAIIDGNETYNRNLGLVRLPFVGTPECRLKKDELDRDRWDGVMARFGMLSLTYRRR